MEYLSYDNRLREFGSFKLEKSLGKPYNTFQLFKAGLQESWRDFLKEHIVIGCGEMALNQRE